MMRKTSKLAPSEPLIANVILFHLGNLPRLCLRRVKSGLFKILSNVMSLTLVDLSYKEIINEFPDWLYSSPLRWYSMMVSWWLSTQVVPTGHELGVFGHWISTDDVVFGIVVVLTGVVVGVPPWQQHCPFPQSSTMTPPCVHEIVHCGLSVVVVVGSGVVVSWQQHFPFPQSSWKTVPGLHPTACNSSQMSKGSSSQWYWTVR